MSIVTIAIVSMAASLFGGKNSNDSFPSNGDIGYIEGKVNLPGDAPGPLSKFVRYYAWTVDNGKKYIFAEYIYGDLLPDSEKTDSGAHIHAVLEKDIPSVSNGGCGVITFYFNPRSDMTPSLYCNSSGPVTFSKN